MVEGDGMGYAGSWDDRMPKDVSTERITCCGNYPGGCRK